MQSMYTKWSRVFRGVAGITAGFILLAGIVSVAIPTPASAAIFGLEQPNLIVCGGEAPDNNHECTFADVYRLAQAIMSFIFFLSVPAAIILFSYAGVLYMTGGDDSAQISKAKGIFTQVLYGFIIICAAWLIVYTVVDALLDKKEYNIIDGQSIKIGN